MHSSKQQKRRILRLAAVVAAVGAVLAFALAIGAGQFDVLDARGTISAQQRNLMGFAAILSLIVIIPVYVLTFVIVRNYKVGAKRPAPYTPDWDGNLNLEILWWGLPAIIILALSVVTWQTTHALDPFKPIASESQQQPLEIQVVALQWKWLFIYPEQGIASVNYVQFPADRPVRFTITSDAPMNSFWIPQLGGQIYAMSGMKTQLNLEANQTGTFRGVSANLSGEGFADMDFAAQATTPDAFQIWTTMTSQQSPPLGNDEYNVLSKPNVPKATSEYKLTNSTLFDTVVNKYMTHSNDTEEGTN